MPTAEIFLRFKDAIHATPAGLYNFCAVIGISLCTYGAAQQFGAAYACIVAGALILILNIYAAERR